MKVQSKAGEPRLETDTELLSLVPVLEADFCRFQPAGEGPRDTTRG